MNKNIKNIIIADQSLVNYMGHSFEYAHSISSYAKELGYQVAVLANKSVSQTVIEDIAAIPCFRYGLDHGFDSPIFRELPDNFGRNIFNEWNYKCHEKTMYSDLCNAERRINISIHSVMIFHTIRHNQILPIVKWAEHLPKEQCPYFVLVFHFTAYPNFTNPSETERFYCRALNYLENSALKERFRLFADSQDLIEEYQRYTDFPINLLPIPHATTSESFDITDPDNLDVAIPIRLTYMGDARINKGFDLLPYVLNKLNAEFKNDTIECHIQSNVRTSSEWQVILAVSRMRQYKIVNLYETSFSSREYYELLSEAGIVLLPYTLDYYHSQTSGIFSEALAYGKPVIVPRGSWMARQLQEYGAGMTFLPGDRYSLYETIIAAINNYKNLKTLAMKKSFRWRKIHSISAYMNVIVDSFK